MVKDIENGTADEDGGDARAKPGLISSSVMTDPLHGGYQMRHACSHKIYS